VKAAIWEKMALLRARACAGDPRLGEEAMRIARATAYARVSDPAAVAAEIHRLRGRMTRELSMERPGRHDPKLGRGGLIEIELVAQMLQMLNGADARVRTTETGRAIDALAEVGALLPEQAEALRVGYRFLRRIEQRIRIVHADAANLIEERAPGLAPLARRMGIRDLPRGEAAAELVARYREVTSRVRAVYDAVVAARVPADERSAQAPA
jgi:glutamate-ammonia-ligase adenylyltransferase